MNKLSNSIAFCFFVFGSGTSIAQTDVPEPKTYWYDAFGGPLDVGEYQLRFSGYLKTELIFDSRQVAGGREGHFSLFPLPHDYDAECCDINSKSVFHFLPIQSRLNTSITGPAFYDADLTGFLEVDFTGASVIDNGTNHQVGLQSVINTVQVRHAFMRFDWENTSLLLGQYWHPLTTGGYPTGNTVTFLSGVHEPFSRNPQIRLSHMFNDYLEVIGAALGQLDFKSNGPNGFSTLYLRRSMIPNLHAQIKAYWWERQEAGVSFDFKQLVPQNVSVATIAGEEKRFRTCNGVNSFSFMAFTHLQCRRLDWWTKLVYAENLTDHIMLGGYAVRCRDARTNADEYTPIRTFAFVTDIFLKYPVEPGLHIGYTRNLGARHNLFQDPTKDVDDDDRFIIYGRGNPGNIPSSNMFNKINSVLVVAPRLKWHLKPITFAAELEYTRVKYGTLDCDGSVKDSCPISVVRFTVAAYYYF